MTEIIRKEIQQRGPMPFARFMELALFCPNSGYYERGKPVIGRSGDFYTSVSTGSLFGELLASEFAERLSRLPRSAVQLVEAGAHDARLAADILAAMLARGHELTERLEYWIIEPSPASRDRQRTNLDKFAAQVRWFASFDALPSTGVHGVIFSNELLDVMPVRRLGWDAACRTWFEWGVSWENEKFAWTRLLDGHPSLAEDLRCAGFDLPGQLCSVLPDGFILEISSAAAAWWRRAADGLRAGTLLAIDYGLRAEQFLMPERSQGTLRAYHRHHANADLLANPGEQDLTAHVNFTQLQKVGERAGLVSEGLFYQAQFLTLAASKNWSEESGFNAWTPARSREFQTLTHPEHLGRAFQVLVQTR